MASAQLKCFGNFEVGIKMNQNRLKKIYFNQMKSNRIESKQKLKCIEMTMIEMAGAIKKDRNRLFDHSKLPKNAPFEQHARSTREKVVLASARTVTAPSWDTPHFWRAGTKTT
jgi:hypothetical protein